jgi:glycerol-3-phosphate dehydrogenase
VVRNLTNLARHAYDVLVIGGGIYGVCIAWDAVLRGLSVALVEKGDFGHATSSNSLRVIHGGLRYLQHGDIRRVRRSIQERAAFMRIAPHLVHPLPILIPTYGHSLRGKEILSLAIFINKIVGLDRDHLPGTHKQLLKGRVISKPECLRLFPGVCEKGLTGGVIVYDCQMSNSERLVLSFARSASQAGAELANYVEAIELFKDGGRVGGIRARDVLTGDEFKVKAKVVINASGPWGDRLASAFSGGERSRQASLSKAFNLQINRQLISDNAVGVYSQGRFKDRDAIFDKGSRLFFIMPWQHRSLIGTAHLPYDGGPDEFQIAEAEIQDFISEINDAYPAAGIAMKDVERVYGGLLPADADSGGVQLLREHELYDHGKDDHIDGLISVKGVKFTEARYVAEKAVDAAFTKLGKRPPKSMAAVTPLYGGQMGRFENFLTEETQRRSHELSADLVRQLISQYGSGYGSVLKYLKKTPEATTDIDLVTRAEVLHGIREEMAQKLADIVFRRTTVALPGNLTETSLKTCAAVMAEELGWNEERVRRETAEVRAKLSLATLVTEEAA